jgi:exopolyphosphatase/guanosine-5'-triphosphate,3'-diphosphate pyrophosphatase
MDAKRADIIVAGAVILEQVVAAFGIDEIRVSAFARREGVLLDSLSRRDGDSLHHLSDLRRTSIVHVADAFDTDREHSEHLTALALSIYDATRDVHGLPDVSRELLEAAGLLHNVGLVISHAAHHKHSYYVIRNSEHLQGFNDHEIELIAQVARYHRKSAPKDKHPEWAALRSEDRRTVAILAGMLRIAIGLDRSHSLCVERAEVSVDEEAGALRIIAIPAVAADVSLEVYSADQRKELLADALGLDVVIGEAETTVTA